SLALAGCRDGRPEERSAPPPTAPLPSIRFENVSASAGLRYHWPRQRYPLTILQAFGCGCALLDYDGDGWQDVLLVADPHPILYHNLHNGKFADVSAQTGLDRVCRGWKGCAAADYDGDG